MPSIFFLNAFDLLDQKVHQLHIQNSFNHQEGFQFKSTNLYIIIWTFMNAYLYQSDTTKTDNT